MQRTRRAGSTALRSSIVPVGLIVLCGLTALTIQSTASVGAQDASGADLYVANCAGCHQPSGEGLAGTFPPLAGNPAATDPEHVRTVITNGLSGPLEVLGVQYDAVMPAVGGLSDEQMTALVAHVVDLASGVDAPATPDEPSEPATPPPVAEPPTVGDIDRGHDLFLGSNRLDGGGGACASCHTAGEIGNLGGQSLGPDLTGVYQKLGGEPGLTAWLGNPASPTMQPIFTDKPMSDADIADLVAFLGDAPNQDRPNNSSDWLLLAGVGGLAILLGGMAIAWRGMRQTYVQTLAKRPARGAAATTRSTNRLTNRLTTLRSKR